MTKPRGLSITDRILGLIEQLAGAKRRADDLAEFHNERLGQIEDRLAALDGGAGRSQARRTARENIVARRLAMSRPSALAFTLAEDDGK